MVINLSVPSNVGNLQLAKEMLPSEEGLCSIDLVNCLVKLLVKLFVCYLPCLGTIWSIIFESSVSRVRVTYSSKSLPFSFAMFGH
jgi:hypothetical protein